MRQSHNQGDENLQDPWIPGQVLPYSVHTVPRAINTHFGHFRIFNEEKYHKGRDVYNRNAFIFNLCFVFERDAELSGFEPLVRKTARTLRTLEVRLFPLYDIVKRLSS